MKIHKIIVASVLAFALTLSSISTSDLFATTNKDFSDDSTQIPVNNDFVTVPITELTSSSSVEISKNQKNTTATNGTKHNSTVKTKTSQHLP